MCKCVKYDEECRKSDKSAMYKKIDGVNGTCIYLKGNFCSIYENRMLLCRIDESYYAFF